MAEICQMERSAVIESNLGLVHSCAYKFKGRGIEYDDLFQAGCMGLIKAADAFDTTRGVRFSTYAVPVILGEIRRLFRDGGSIKVSRSIKELSMKIFRLREEYARQHGREPSLSEIAVILEVSQDAVVEAVTASAPVFSLSESDDEEGGGHSNSGGGQIDVPVDSPEEEMTDILSLRQTMGKLEEKDRRLLELRYYRHKTQTETARELGMTQVQVSRREKKLLGYMRQEMTG